MAETYVRARIDEQLKIQATAIFEQLGLSMSDFIRIALTRAVLERGIPFEMKIPNAETGAVLDEILSRHKSGQYDMSSLKTAMLHLIANDESLPPEYRDHALSGEYSDFRECHIGGDFLLIYYLNEAQNIIEFARAGTHAELFR